MALNLAGAGDEAVSASDGLLAAAETTDNPFEKVWASMGYGLVRLDVDPVAAFDVLRQGLRIGQGSGNRQLESHTAATLAELAATHGDPIDAFGFFTLAIRHYRDSGSFSHMHTPLGSLATFFDRLGHYEPAATIIGFAADFFMQTTYPQIEAAFPICAKSSASKSTNHSLAQAQTCPTRRWRAMRSTRSTKLGPVCDKRRNPDERPNAGILGSAHLLIHRYRGVDAAVGSRPSRDAGGAGSP